MNQALRDRVTMSVESRGYKARDACESGTRMPCLSNRKSLQNSEIQKFRACCAQPWHRPFGPVAKPYGPGSHFSAWFDSDVRRYYVSGSLRARQTMAMKRLG